MNKGKADILDWIERDRDRLIGFLSGFLQARSPNPPGDTREAGDYVRAFLEAEALTYSVVSPHPEMPNFIASFEGDGAGRHLVLNGHMDVFPVGQSDAWKHGPWSGAVADGCIWGRGAVDMKCGTTASLFTYLYLHRLRERLRGRLTLTVVSDEETFGPWGARYLMEHHPEVHGDCCLSGEPSDPTTVRFGEKGPLWLVFNIKTAGAHGAYPHLSKSATKIAASLIQDLEAVTRAEATLPDNVTAILEGATAAIDRALGEGAAAVMRSVTFNVGVIRGGLKVNMIPAECSFEADFRLPIGMTRERMLSKVREIVARYPEVSFEEANFSAPNWCDPEHPMVGILQANVKALKGFEPQPMVGLGATDMRLWRYQDVPAYVYGPSPRTMGKTDERIEIEEFLHIVRTHALSAYDYLTS
ncbi:MAG: succinyl-diaminopimelate desuccinylase [Rhodospirillaceae bacterium]|jgi:succinyl-diaminopimelate desuccinylase|nr:succinyl-diaminopimelate desuccinylase [Rhodospirillaceae bacterium]